MGTKNNSEKWTVPLYVSDKMEFQNYYDKEFFKSFMSWREFLNICSVIFDLI